MLRRQKNPKLDKRLICQHSLRIIVCLFLSTGPFFALSAEQQDKKELLSWKGSLRTTFLKSLDKMLSAIFDEPSRTYSIVPTQRGETFQNHDLAMHGFISLHGYFSEVSPIVGKFTKNEEDLHVTKEILKVIHERINDPFQREITAAEVITKVLAYRDLKKGDTIALPTLDAYSRAELTPYVVDEVLDLWHGMPAFGLLPQVRTGNGESLDQHVPILLFRGTDLSLITERGWASVISDLEIHDPGLSAFQKGQAKVHAWLEKAEKYCCKARVMGFSLGGILTAYTLLYEGELVNRDKTSFSFSAPGVSREVLQEWVQETGRPPFLLFIPQGDIIPKYGRLFKNAFLLSTDKVPAPLAAHTGLITFSEFFRLNAIDTAQENALRKL